MSPAGVRSMPAAELAGHNNEVVVYGVDAQGYPLGLVPREQAFVVTDRQPTGPGWRLDLFTREWFHEPTLVEALGRALQAIDDAAGAARLRFITDVPGQEGVYVRKAEAARSFAVAGYAGDVPPYVQAEMAAMGEGTTAQQACDNILQIAAVWDDQISPTIERLRLTGKRLAKEAAATPDERAARQALAAALSSAVAELAAIAPEPPA